MTLDELITRLQQVRAESKLGGETAVILCMAGSGVASPVASRVCLEQTDDGALVEIIAEVHEFGYVDDRKIYKLLIDIDEPTSGPPMRKGMLVRIISSENSRVNLVETINEHMDPAGDAKTYARSVSYAGWNELEEYS